MLHREGLEVLAVAMEPVDLSWVLPLSVVILLWRLVWVPIARDRPPAALYHVAVHSHRNPSRILWFFFQGLPTLLFVKLRYRCSLHSSMRWKNGLGCVLTVWQDDIGRRRFTTCFQCEEKLCLYRSTCMPSWRSVYRRLKVADHKPLEVKFETIDEDSPDADSTSVASGSESHVIEHKSSRSPQHGAARLGFKERSMAYFSARQGLHGDRSLQHIFLRRGNTR